MSSIDQRVVEMQFDNEQFTKGVSDSLKDLDNLKKGLKLDGATSGLDKVSSAVDGFSTSKMESALEHIAGKFTALGAIGFTVIQNLTNSAINFGKNAFSSILDPIIQGGETRAHNIEQAQFQFKGLGLNVQEVMQNALDAVKGTAYGLDSAAKVASQFGASGIKAGAQMTGALRGVAGLAAMTGSTFDDVGQIFTTVAGNGKLMSEQLYQFSSRGINVAAAMAKQLGKSETQVRAMITDGKIDFQTFATLMDQAFGAHAKDANQTYMGSLDNLHAALSRIGADFATAKFAGQRDIFNALSPAIDKVHEALKPVIDLYAEFRGTYSANVVKFINGLSFDSLTKSMPFVVDSIRHIYTLMQQFVNVFKGAWSTVFPPASADIIVKIAQAIELFTRRILMTAGTMDNLKRTFAGVFAVVDILWQLLKAAGTFLVQLIGHFTQGGTNISGFTAKIGDFLVNLDKAIKAGNIFGKFFDWLLPKVEAPVDALKHFIAMVKELVKAIAGSASMTAILDGIHRNANQLADAGNWIADAWGRVKIIFHAVAEALAPVFHKIGSSLKDIMKDVADFIGSLSFTNLLAGAGVGGFLMLVNKIRDTIDNLFNKKDDDNKPGILDKVKESLDSLTGTLESMQQALKATTILEIAAAIGILTISVSVLSKIDAVGLVKAVTAIGVMATILIGALKLLDTAMGSGKGLKMDLMAAGLILIATAIDILASAVKKMAGLSWNDLTKGLTGTVVLLTAVAGAMKLMPEKSKMISSGIGILIIAEAIKVLVDAVKQISDLSWGDIAKGLTGIAALLLALGLYTKFSDMSSIGDGAGILLMAAAIKVLASAMTDIADLSWNDIAKGLTGVAGGLVAMSAAMQLLPAKGNLINGAAIVEVAAALKVLASAMQDMSGLSWEDIGKATTAIVGGLGLIVVALNAMPEGSSLGNAASLLIVTGAIKVLASAMQDLGGMSWSDIAAGLTALAGGMLIMVVALDAMDGTIPGALALLAAAPGIAALASAMQNLGGMSWSDIAAGLVALAGSLAILAVGLYAMEGTLPGSLGLLAAAPGLNALAGAMQSLGSMSWSDIGAALVAMGGALVVLAVGLTAMIVTLPGAAALAVAAPALGALATAMQMAGAMSWADIGAGIVAIGGALTALAVGLTTMIAAAPGAAALLIAAPALGRLADAMVKIGAMSWSDIAAAGVAIGGFLTSMAVGLTAMIAAAPGAAAVAIAAPALKSFISAVQNSKGVGDNVKVLADALKELAKVPADALNKIATAADKISKALPGLQHAVATGILPNTVAITTAGADLVNNFAKGINDNSRPATDAGTNLANKVKDAINKAIQTVASQVSGTANSIGANIVAGVNKGVDNNAGSLNAKMRTMATNALNAAKQALGIKSPSKKFQEIGQYVAEGFAIGLTGRSEKVESATDSLVNGMMSKFDDAIQSNLDDISKHQDAINNLRDNMNSNAQDIAEAQQKVNEALADPIKKSTSKSRTTRNQQNAAYLKEHNDAVNSARAALDKLIAKQNDYQNSINAEQAAINQDTDETNKLNAAKAELTNQLADEQAKLNDLADARDANNQAIADEQKVLDDAIRTRDDYNQSLRDQYGAQKDISKETKLSDYVKDLQDQIVATQQYTTAIQELRKRGLNDELYKQLLAKGPTEGMPFVQQLLEGGQEAVDNLNYLGKSLDAAAGTLGDDASSALYQAGVDAASGILKGLQSKAADIQAQMDAIAKYMVDAINKALGIHSPSRVMAEVGNYAAQGLVKGLSDSADQIKDASAAVGQSAIDGMKKTIAGLGDLVSESVDVNPTITPVLDLSAIQKDASTISDLLSVPKLSVGSTFSQASDASAGYAANQAALLAALTPPEPPAPISFTQINNSPKALSSAELYRQTNNQISVAKGALTTSARKS